MRYYGNRTAERASAYKELFSDVRAKLEKENPRREVSQEEDIGYTSNFTEIVKKAKEFAKKWKKTIDDVRLEHSSYDDYGSTCSEAHFEVRGLESDEQYYARLAEHYEATRYQEERDRAEFERLKNKFK